jgi:octaprenyl-diphosphate synthase
MSIHHIKTLVSQELEQVNSLIHQLIQVKLPLITQMTEHLLLGGGKQLRPLIALLCCRALNYTGVHHINLAAMLEFFHTATLLHDDVIDESKLRRGRETAHEIWGNKASVLVGDYLFTIHTQLLVQIGNLQMVEVMNEIASQIGFGEIKQLLKRHQTDLSIAEYFEIIQAKTSLLFSAAASLAGILAGDFSQEFYKYGLHLGNAFQIIDDILDYSSNTQTIGKNIGDDLTDGKMTLPLIFAYQKGNTSQKELIQNTLNLGPDAHTNFTKILEIIEETHALAYSREIALQEAKAAQDAIQELPPSVYKDALMELATYSVQREH